MLKQTLALVGLSLSLPVNAGTVFLTGSFATSADHGSTFETNGASLGSYSEDSLLLTTASSAAPFETLEDRSTGFYYEQDVNNSNAGPGLAANRSVNALQLLVGDGYTGIINTAIIW